MPYTAQAIIDIETANNIPADAIKINTTSGGIAWIQPNTENGRIALQKYQTGVLSGAYGEAVPAGVILVANPPPASNANNYNPTPTTVSNIPFYTAPVATPTTNTLGVASPIATPAVTAFQFTYSPQAIIDIETANNIPADAIRLNTTSGGLVWIQAGTAAGKIALLKYQSGELTGAYGEAAPAGVILVANPPPPSNVNNYDPTAIKPPTTTPPVITPVVSNPVPVTPPQNPTTATGPIAAPIDLAGTLQISTNVIDREYIKDSMIPITSQQLEFRNITTNINLTIGIRSTQGVIFTPSNFQLAAAQVQQVVVTFDTAAVNALPEGLNSVVPVIDVTSNSVITQNPATPIPVPPVVPTPVVPPPMPPVIPTIPSPVPVTPFEPAGPPPTEPPVVTFPPEPPLVPIDPVPPPFAPIPFTPDPTPPTQTTTGFLWVNGTTRNLEFGRPPDGWVQDPFGGEWYPPDDPFVLSGWGRGTTPAPVTPVAPQPVAPQPATPKPTPVTPPTPIPPTVFEPPVDTGTGGVNGGGAVDPSVFEI